MPQHYTTAVKWYQKAVNGSSAAGMSNVGYLYQSGLGVEKDEQKAQEWYQKAAEADKNFTEAIFAVKNCRKNLIERKHQVLRKMQVNKWNGVTPQCLGGNAFIPFLPVDKIK